MIKPYLVSLTLLFVCLSSFVFGQSGISIRGGVEIPQGDMKWVYKTGQGIAATYVHKSDESNFQWEIGIGYEHFVPKQDTFYYLVDNGLSYGTATYSTFTVIPLFVGGSYNVPIAKTMDISLGIDVGYYYIYQKSESSDIYAHITDTNIEGKGGICPRLGFGYTFNEKLRVGLQYNFNFLASLGSGDPNSNDYNPNAGSIITTSSLGLKLTYFFGNE